MDEEMQPNDAGKQDDKWQVEMIGLLGLGQKKPVVAS